MHHLEKYGQISDSNLQSLLFEWRTTTCLTQAIPEDVIVHGPNGHLVKARTPNQKKMLAMADHDDIIFAIGPAGTGKTYTAVALAVRALKDKLVKRIIPPDRQKQVRTSASCREI